MRDKYLKSDFKWVVFGLGVASVLILSIVAWLIVRIVDGNWASWQLPTILGIAWLAVTIVVAMFVALPDIKKELEKEAEKGEE
ncbi:MAG: hypothetical protein FWE38_04865 [Firmicutes bacterium]|nr:hypothetical protein [Bacillota bacterium]